MSEPAKTPSASPSPGFYPDGQGGQKWWDGERWVDHQPPVDARKAKLDSDLEHYVNQGYRIESRTDYQAVIVSGRPVNHILHLILTLVTFGLWGIVWLAIALTGGEKRRVISA
ncbi:MAG: DUF2510 domain-containing protein [Thermoleophilia bacterium]|nr:DUF2510 domain-containing protein [Thermoleophilia bacterium]